MSTHNISFHGELEKIIPELTMKYSSITPLEMVQDYLAKKKKKIPGLQYASGHLWT